MKKSLLLLLFLMAGLSSVEAQVLVYRPQNPAFGGNSFNAGWLQASAQVQDKTKDPTASTLDPFGRNNPLANRNTLDDFSESLSRQLLSRITSQLISSQFGEQSLQEGTFQFGNLRVDITNGANGVNIRIVDGQGGETTVTIPYF